jgi:uncharacterized protein YndB with AHSA1/START domain
MTSTITPAGTGAIERTLDLRAPRETVWRAITEPDALDSWFGGRCRLDLRPGGDGVFEWPEHGEAGVRFAARVEAVEAPSFLAWRWARESDTPVDAGPSTLVEWRLESLPGGGTRLHLRESGFERPESRIDNAHGWHLELGDLAAAVATQPWEAGIRKRWTLRSPRDRVWAALTDPAQLAAWWSGNPTLEIATGAEGWFTWEGMGRFGCRFEAVEPPSYLCWSWVTVPDVRVADAEAGAEVLRTEWVLTPTADGGTELSLFESGFAGPEGFAMNSGGWDGDILPALRRLLGEPAAD